MFFSSSCEILYPKYVNGFHCSEVVFSIKVLLLIGSAPLNAITLEFSGDFSCQTVSWCSAEV
jgi:hypothetical protein